MLKLNQQCTKINSFSSFLFFFLRKIDVINYYENPVLYIAEALKPAEVVGVSIAEDGKNVVAVVKDDSFSLAIGKKGINARLAVNLTGYKIDIKTLTKAVEEVYI